MKETMLEKNYCFPPPIWPSPLEKLARLGSTVIDCVEQGKLESLLSDEHRVGLKYFKDSVHRYQKLFDYLEAGYKSVRESEKKKDTYTSIGDFYQNNLYLDYKSIVADELPWFNEGFTRYYVYLKRKKSLKTNKQFYEQYLVPAKNAWNNLSQIKPEDKATLELMRKFNDAARAIGQSEANEHTDSEYTFNDKKDEWEHGDKPFTIKY